MTLQTLYTNIENYKDRIKDYLGKNSLTNASKNGFEIYYLKDDFNVMVNLNVNPAEIEINNKSIYHKNLSKLVKGESN